MYKEQILQWLRSHQEEMLSDISDLICINSEKMPAEPGKPYGAGPAAALELALSKAEDYGFATTNYDNYVGCADFNDGARQLDILAHLDVVPVEPENWTVTAPFTPIVKDGCLYGRGSSDDKGPAVAALYAMRAVKELGIPLKSNVRLILGCDEECGSTDIAYYYAKEPEAPMTFSPDAEFPVINLEKGHYVDDFTACWETGTGAGMRVKAIKCGSKFNVIPGECVITLTELGEEAFAAAQTYARELGVSLLTEQTDEGVVLHVAGKSGHAASPESANNALTAALTLLSEMPLCDGPQTAAIHALSKLFPHGDYAGAAAGVAMSDEISGALTISLNMMTLDEQGMRADFDSRFPVCGNEENIVQVLKARGAALGLTLSENPMTQPHYVPEDSPFIRSLLQAYEMYSGKPGRCMAIGGGTYVHNLKNGVAFGPVELTTQTNLHGNDENIPVEELIISAAIYAQSIILLCGEDA
jgi:succinyl-diaminopimelate desuccinylase